MSPKAQFYLSPDIATTTIYTHLTEPTRASLRKLLDKVMSGF
jgi:hypothetical protein